MWLELILNSNNLVFLNIRFTLGESTYTDLKAFVTLNRQLCKYLDTFIYSHVTASLQSNSH